MQHEKRQLRDRRTWPWLGPWMAAWAISSLAFVGPAAGQECNPQECPGTQLGAHMCAGEGEDCIAGVTYPVQHPCRGGGCNLVLNCRPVQVAPEPFFETIEQPDGKLTARMGFEVHAPWNQEAGDGDDRDDNVNGTLDMLWFNRPNVCQAGLAGAQCQALLRVAKE